MWTKKFQKKGGFTMAKRQPPKTETSVPTGHLSDMPFTQMLASFANGSMDLVPQSSGMSLAMRQDLKPSRRPPKEESKTTFSTQEDEIDEEAADQDLLFDVYREEMSVDSLRAERMRKTADEEEFPYREDFDDLIEGAFQDDEDVAFRNSLIAMGRKYAIKGMEEDQGTSEVSRAFSQQEKAIYDILEENRQVSMALQNDIDFMRMARTRNFKSLSDMIEVRASLLDGRLRAIQELNRVAEKKFTLTAKVKEAEGDEDGAMTATRAVQKIFSMGRGALALETGPGDSGGRSTFSTESVDSADDIYDSDERPENVIMRESDLPPAVTDGDKFIEHEREGVEYVLDIGEGGDERNIYAINRHGDVVPDYPLPSDPNSLNFSINEMTGTAVDQLQRTYLLRKNGQEIVHESDDD